MIITPEFGGAVSTSGGSAFLRGVIGNDAKTTVVDLEGLGTSVSIGVGPFSSSITFPGDPNKLGVEAPIYEVGVGIGIPGISLTESIGLTPQETADILVQGAKYGESLINNIRSSSNGSTVLKK